MDEDPLALLTDDEEEEVQLEDESSDEEEEEDLELKKKREMLENQLLHITTEPLWNKAQQTGNYTHPTLRKDGYIHCYTHAQIGAAANHFFRKQKKLWVLVIDKRKLKADLKFETMRPNLPPFPHVFGPINLDCIIECKVVQKKFERWHITLCSAPCKAPGLWCKSCFTPCCSAYSQRVELLEAEGGMKEKYLCCNGVFCSEDCCATECCCRKCPHCCLCIESFVCCWCAIVANRGIIQRRYGIKNSKCEACVFKVCIVVGLIAMLCPIDAPGLDLIVDCMYCAIGACMLTQQKTEMEKRKKLDTAKKPPGMSMK